MKHFEGWGTPDHSLTYYAVRAAVRAFVWSGIAVGLLGWAVAGVWTLWMVTQ